jgi:hypothetical protein
VVLDTIIRDQDIAKSISSDDAKQLKEHYKTQKKQQQKDREIASRTLSATSSTPVINNQTTEPELSSPLSITSDRERRSFTSPGSEKQGTSDPKQDIIQVIRKQRVWRIGDNQQHVIVAADPNSLDFLRELPADISLCLAFPPQQNWQFQFKHCDTTNIFHSKHEDLDSLLFLGMTNELIQGSTNENDAVVICYIPEPKILLAAHNLGCHAYIADPDYQKCLDLIELFNQTFKG